MVKNHFSYDSTNKSTIATSEILLLHSNRKLQTVNKM